MYSVYLIRNTQNGMCYVGKAEKPFRRWSQHVKNALMGYGFRFHAAIREHGLTAFTFCVLSQHPTEEEAFIAEVNAINLFSSFGSRGYNDTMGGEGALGFKHSEETRRKLSESHKGKVMSVAIRNKIAKSNTGKIRSNEHKRHLSESNRGKHDYRGERHPRSKLTDVAASEIRKLWLETTVTRQELCERFQITLGVLNPLLRGRTYRHLLL
jgi:group I intron endonuclease